MRRERPVARRLPAAAAPQGRGHPRRAEPDRADVARRGSRRLGVAGTGIPDARAPARTRPTPRLFPRGDAPAVPGGMHRTAPAGHGGMGLRDRAARGGRGTDRARGDRDSGERVRRAARGAPGAAGGRGRGAVRGPGGSRAADRVVRLSRGPAGRDEPRWRSGGRGHDPRRRGRRVAPARARRPVVLSGESLPARSAGAPRRVARPRRTGRRSLRGRRPLRAGARPCRHTGGDAHRRRPGEWSGPGAERAALRRARAGRTGERRSVSSPWRRLGRPGRASGRDVRGGSATDGDVEGGARRGPARPPGAHRVRVVRHRDAGARRARIRRQRVRPSGRAGDLDLFPNTAHVETAATFAR
jgi:hypothetical protein